MLINPLRVGLRALVAALLFLCCRTAQAQHPHSPVANSPAAPPDRPSTHGMLVFGNGHVFASHLPMFHSPHDYQVVLELELSDSVKAAYHASRRQFSQETVYTLEPEVFVLPEMLQQPRPFRATLYRGHFERGGTPIARQITVRIKQVLYAERLVPSGSPVPTPAVLLVGEAPDQYVLHRIGRRPDFDQVAMLTNNNNGSVGKLIPHTPLLQVLPAKAAKAPVRPGQRLYFRPTAPFMPAQLTIGRTIYLEHNDLR